MSADIGIDLGTSSVLVYIQGRGIVLSEPSVVAVDRDTGEVKAIGEEAKAMFGRTPGNLAAVRPLNRGVISDYTVTEKMLAYFIQKSVGRRSFLKPRVNVCVPSGVTEVEKKAVEEATLEAGAREVLLIEEPVAAAIGAGIDIAKACGNFIVDIGGGTTDIAVISLGGAVVKDSLKIGGNDFDDELSRYLRRHHNLLIGEHSAERVKMEIGTVYPLPQVMRATIRGRNMITGLPRTATLTSEDLRGAFAETANRVVEGVIGVLEQTPPELSSDILERGIVLTGGSSLLRGMDRLIEEKTGIHTLAAEDPLTAVAVGTGEYGTLKNRLYSAER